MVSRLSEQDQELLSAYLDGALSPADRANLESRLADEPALRAELDSLRSLVQVMRAAPMLTPPRNFTLDPARHQRRPVIITRYTVMRWGGAIGTVAAVLMIVMGVLLTGTQLMGAPAAQPAALLSTVNAVYQTSTQTAVALIPSQTQNAQQARTSQKDKSSATIAATATRVPATATPPPSPTSEPQSTEALPTSIPATAVMEATQLTSSGPPTAVPTLPSPYIPFPAPATGSQEAQAGGGSDNVPVPRATNIAAADGAAEAPSPTVALQPVQPGAGVAMSSPTIAPTVTPTQATNSAEITAKGTATAAMGFAATQVPNSALPSTFTPPSSPTLPPTGTATTLPTTAPLPTKVPPTTVPPSPTATSTALPTNMPLPTKLPTTVPPPTKVAVLPTPAPTQPAIRAGESEDSAANASRLLLIGGITLLLLSVGALVVGWYRRQAG